MAKIISLILFCVPTFLWSNQFNLDSVISLVPKNFTGQIVIKQDRNIVFNKNFGLKERVFKTSINDSTVFNIGQISHSIIYYLFDGLVKKGALQKKDIVTKYISKFPYQDIKIEHLLMHQSGLPKSYVKLFHRKVYNNWHLKITERETRFDNQDILDILINEKPKLNFVPGDSTIYSNLNYLILTLLIEEITKTSFPLYVKTIFKEELSFFPILSAKKDTVFNKAFGYRCYGDSIYKLCENLRTRNMPYDDGTYGNQHIYLSAINLANWGQFLLKQFETKSLENLTNIQFMRGFVKNNNFQMIKLNGAFGGVSSKLILIPRGKIVTAINSALLQENEKKEEFNPLYNYLKKLN